MHELAVKASVICATNGPNTWPKISQLKIPYPVPIESNRSITITVAKEMNMIDATSFSIESIEDTIL